MHWSRFASAKTMAGFLPPSSSESFLQYGALRSVMRWAVAVEPVKEINGTSGWPTRASPALGPVPNTMLTTPGGTPTEMDGWASFLRELLCIQAGSQMHCGRCSPTGLLHQLAHHPRGHGGHLAGFRHHCVARGDCRCNLPGQEVQREIPRADQTSCKQQQSFRKKKNNQNTQVGFKAKIPERSPTPTGERTV